MSNQTNFFNGTGDTNHTTSSPNPSISASTITWIAAGLLALHVIAFVIACCKKKQNSKKVPLLH